MSPQDKFALRVLLFLLGVCALGGALIVFAIMHPEI